MLLKVRQEYFTFGNSFTVRDESDRLLYYAAQRSISTTDLLDGTTSARIYSMQIKLMHFFSYYVLGDALGNEIGYIDERFHMPGFRRAKMAIGDRQIKIKAGPLHMKAFEKGENGKWDKKNSLVYSTKRVSHIADTYEVIVDDNRIDLRIAALVAVWYDKVRHGKKH